MEATTDPRLTPESGVESLIDAVRSTLRAALGVPGAPDGPRPIRLGVAFSGGVDSAVLLAVAGHVLGSDNVVAIIADSPSLPRSELAAARALAASIGTPIEEVATHEGENPDYIANDVDRCFYCKDELFTQIDDTLVDSLQLTAVAYGENADDALRPDRPGAQAATDHGVLRPLADAGLTKADVRAIARHLALPVADKPAAPCLASRIPHGEKVTPAKLRQVEEAEAVVRAQGFSDCRVRHHGATARLEVPVAEFARFADDGVRRTVHSALREIGFRNVTVDLAGLQSGAFTLEILRSRPGSEPHEPSAAGGLRSVSETVPSTDTARSVTDDPPAGAIRA